MNAVGIFSGRGDVILAMGFAILVGAWAGWKAKSLHNFLKSKMGKSK